MCSLVIFAALSGRPEHYLPPCPDKCLLMNKTDKYLFFLLLALVLLDRLNVLLNFAFVYTDNDQALLWTAAKDLMRGEFHGLCFYGQKYNPLLEPLLALPLLWAGMDFYKALPVVTSLLATAPFVAASFFFYKKKGVRVAFIPLLMLLLLPPEYLMLTSMPRGFSGGIFFAFAGVLLFLYSSVRTTDMLAGFCLAFGFFVSPNSILLFPLLIPAFFEEEKKIHYRWIPFSTGAALGWMPWVYNYFYYKSHPEMLIHSSPDMAPDFSVFMGSLGSLDLYFDFVSPVFWRGGWITLLLFLPAAFFFRKKKQTGAYWMTLALFAGLVLSLSVKKVADSTNSVFFSGSRMFLAYPLLLTFLLSKLYIHAGQEKKERILYFFLVVSVVLVAIKILFFNAFLKYDLRGSKYTVVQVAKVQELTGKCKSLLTYAEEKPDLLLAASPGTSDALINYGCHCLVEGFPPGIQPLYERRTWLLPLMSERVYSKVLIYGVNKLEWLNTDSSGLDILKKDTLSGFVLINNTKNTGELLRSTGLLRPEIPVRP
jgi:hypothetical protein